MSNNLSTKKMKVFTNRNFMEIPELNHIDSDIVKDIEILRHVFPFRVNNYVLENLINWNDIPNDPMYRLVFPHREMLSEEDYSLLQKVLSENDEGKLNILVHKIRLKMNPHPAGQMDKNVPELNGRKLKGIQHKYKETVLFFPKESQTCHSYCSYCFRWPQFLEEKSMKFSSTDIEELPHYLSYNRDVTDVLFTGGDPMILNSRKLTDYMEILLEPQFSNVQNIRIGTKSLTYWPFRYLSDSDSDEIIELFERIISSGKNLFIMAHFSHWSELNNDLVIKAVERLKRIGASVYSQAPMLRHINDDAMVWKKMWKMQLDMGIVPYYMFMSRDTGANKYFGVPIAKAIKIYRDIITNVSGLTKTVRGPVMSTYYGKVEVQGITEIKNEKYFCLRFIQARNTDWINRPFFAKYSTTALWLNDLEPAFEDKKFFFQE
ncbi:MAG: hypothetical protein ABF289_12705 [Clostridiales bacterium]